MNTEKMAASLELEVSRLDSAELDILLRTHDTLYGGVRVLVSDRGNSLFIDEHPSPASGGFRARMTAPFAAVLVGNTLLVCNIHVVYRLELRSTLSQQASPLDGLAEESAEEPAEEPAPPTAKRNPTAFEMVEELAKKAATAPTPEDALRWAESAKNVAEALSHARGIW